MPLVDSHAHLDFVDDLDGVLRRAKAEGVKKIISVGTTCQESKRIIEIADKHSDGDLQIYTTCGIHPGDGKEEIEKIGLSTCINSLTQVARSSKRVVAIGECGLDYYLVDRGQRLEVSDKEREFQRELFEAQIKLAMELNLPLVVHCRNGWADIFDLLTSNGKRLMAKGVFHSWTGNWEAAHKALDLGFYISFSGIVTFKNAPDVQEVAKKAPIDRILLETDSPFLSPEPNRGKKNEPKNVKIIAQFVAGVRNQPFDAICTQTSQNAERLFGIG